MARHAQLSGAPWCQYAGVLDGDNLWLAVRTEHVEGATVTLCHRQTGQVTTLPTHAEQVTPGSSILVSEVSLLGTSGVLDPRPGPFDVKVTVATARSGRSTSRVLTDTAALAPKDPTQTPLSSDGRWSLKPYRTQGGYLALRCDSAPPTCQVDSVTVGPHDMRLRAHLLGTEEPATRLVLRRRRDGESIRLDLASATEVDVALPLDAIGALAGRGVDVWNFYVATASEEVRAGRPRDDLKNLTSAIRYDTLLYGGLPRRMAMRPYFSLDRFLALEVKPLEAPPSA